jgi:heptosyltransferase-2
MRRIAVWNTAFLGDAVLTLPLLQTLHAAYPGAELDFYVRRGFASLFQAHPAITRVYEHDKRGSQRGLPAILRFGRELASRDYDLWISAHQSPRSAFLAWLSRAESRLGYDAPRIGRLFYTETVPRAFPALHEVDRLLQLAGKLGLKNAAPWPEIFLPGEARNKADVFFASRGIRPILGLHPGSVWGTKRWPAEYFAQLALLALEQGANIALFAGPGEEESARLVLENIQKRAGKPYPVGRDLGRCRIADLSARLNLPELAAFIAGLDCYVSNDSGPMHLAWAQGTPLVALFGPTVRELGFAPRGEKSFLLETTGLPCRPCGLHGPQTCPRGHHRCMRDLRPETVWQAVLACGKF